MPDLPRYAVVVTPRAPLSTRLALRVAALLTRHKRALVPPYLDGPPWPHGASLLAGGFPPYLVSTATHPTRGTMGTVGTRRERPANPPEPRREPRMTRRSMGRDRDAGPARDGDEQDVHSRFWRRHMIWQPGEVAKVKRRTNKRARRAARAMIRREADQ